MRKIIIAAAATMLMLLALTSQAFAWQSKATLLSCGEADFTLSQQEVPWTYTVYQDGKVIKSGVFSNPTIADVSIGVRATDDLPHKITVTVANTANPRDGLSSISALFVGCGPTSGPAGPAGPKGDKGDPGVGTPGTNGKDGVTTTVTKTVVERQAPRVCTSRRSYSFRVRKDYVGSKIVKVSAAENGVQINVTRKNGRFVVSWSTQGKKYTPGGVLRSVTVNATMANGKHVRLRWLYRPCLASDGTINDPSAAGQGANGGA